jgi:hypothetical protein
MAGSLMARLATLLSQAGLFYFPILEDIMTDLKDRQKPGQFLELFPHPLSRLYLTLLWKINAEQDGDAAVLSNVWLRGFAKLDEKSLRKYRSFLHDGNIIHAAQLGSGREYLYRLVNPNNRRPLDENEPDGQATERLSNPDRIKEAARARAIKRYSKKPAVPSGTEEEKPSIDGQSPKVSSWDIELG